MLTRKVSSSEKNLPTPKCLHQIVFQNVLLMLPAEKCQPPKLFTHKVSITNPKSIPLQANWSMTIKCPHTLSTINCLNQKCVFILSKCKWRCARPYLCTWVRLNWTNQSPEHEWYDVMIGVPDIGLRRNPMTQCSVVQCLHPKTITHKNTQNVLSNLRCLCWVRKSA